MTFLFGSLQCGHVEIVVVIQMGMGGASRPCFDCGIEGRGVSLNPVGG